MCRRFLRLVGVACWPSSTDAASPGRNSVAEKMIRETTRRVAKIRVSRTIRKRNIAQTSSQKFVSETD